MAVVRFQPSSPSYQL
uniref:Uncharacterized protein n=1 Tax=Anguilla anguilla TaxID=7936 RepID=A0A0E9PNB4_ANGAN